MRDIKRLSGQANRQAFLLSDLTVRENPSWVCISLHVTCSITTCKSVFPLVLYAVSTDLSYSMAHDRTWIPFGLNYPGRRIVPFDTTGPTGNTPQSAIAVKLTKFQPFSNDSINGRGSVSAFINHHPEEADPLEVGFVDLAANTAGDDWGFINRMLALLPVPGKRDPIHLMILDAVEGFETLVGDLDAYGQISSRRSRIAQMMRSALRTGSVTSSSSPRSLRMKNESRSSS